MSRETIFSTLAKYNSATDENYLTESFVFLLNSLLERERPVAVEILNRLCVNDNEFCFDADETISISTQVDTEQGTPDITVSTLDKLIYVEVKHESPLGDHQIEQYTKALDSFPTIKDRHVVLLTRYSVDFGAGDPIPYKHVQWFDVHNWLANAKPQDEVSAYRIEQFKSFLEEKRMSIERVGWEYINGVPAWNNLIRMVEKAIQDASLTISQRSGSVAYRGFYLGDQKEFWCGILYEEPLLLIFEIENKTVSKSFLKDFSYSWRESQAGLFQFYVNLEDSMFFTLSKEKQLAVITDFVKVAHKGAITPRPPSRKEVK